MFSVLYDGPLFRGKNPKFASSSHMLGVIRDVHKPIHPTTFGADSPKPNLIKIRFGNDTCSLDGQTLPQHYKGKGKVVPVLKHHAMKTHWGSGGIAPRILSPRH
jgi:hypothetical protein